MTLYYTEQEQDSFKKDLETINIHTKLSFLGEHNGLRRGSLHTILGSTSSGKTTLIRTILRDMIFNKDNTLRIGVWLSEESILDYKNQISYSMPSCEKLLLTTALSEVENDIDEEFFFTWIRANSLDVLFIDNITTSKFYMDCSIAQQSNFAKKIKAITKELNIATVLVAHTDAKFQDNGDKLIAATDIRGCKSISNLCEFFYGIQKIEIPNGFFSTIRILKHRSQEITDNLFHLKYRKEIRAFEKDEAIPFEDFKEVYAKRNNLRSGSRVKK